LSFYEKDPNITFVIASMKSLTNGENPSSNPPQEAGREYTLEKIH
jgi:hypothetical protein